MIRAKPHAPTDVLPLESGDRMTRHEFHRRFEMHPEIKKAELIEGVVYVASPTRFEYHSEPANNLATWIGVYKAKHPGEVRGGNEATVQLDPDNEPMPDLCLWRVGGKASLDDKGYIVGPPELVVEIAASSVSFDLHQKKNAYRRNGVQEYIVWRVYDEAIEWWELRDGEYVALEPDERGVIESRVFPGLRLDVAAMLRDDLAAVLATLNQ